MCVNPVEVGRMESMRRAVCLKELRARHEIEDVERRYIYGLIAIQYTYTHSYIHIIIIMDINGLIVLIISF